jgi:hypothetical protein
VNVRIRRSLDAFVRRARRCSQRTAACVVCAIVLLVVALAPHVPMTVCTGDCCAAADEPASCCEGGCCAGGAPHDPAPGEERSRDLCGPHCCVDLLVDVDPAPVPGAPEREHPRIAICALPLAGCAAPRAGWPEWTTPHDTGPPRVDRRTTLIASTVLRL